MDEHLTEFAGYPVVGFPCPDGVPAPPVNSCAWRVRAGEPGFVSAFEGFLAAGDPEQVRALVIGSWGAGDSGEAVRLLCAAAGRFPELRSLFLGDIPAREREISGILQSDVSPLLAALPQLEQLWIRGATRLDIRPLDHRRLRALVVQSGGLSGEFVRHLDACTLPSLESLELYLGADDFGGDATASDFSAILHGERFPKLAHLGLRDALAADEMAGALADAPVVGRLDVLDLSLGALTDRGGEALLEGQSLTHLARLDLRHHYLSDVMMERLEEEFLGTGTEVDLGDQQEVPEYDEDGEPVGLAVVYSE